MDMQSNTLGLYFEHELFPVIISIYLTTPMTFSERLKHLVLFTDKNTINDKIL